MRPSSRYRPGESGNPNGCPKEKNRGGRNPDWLRQKCQRIFRKRNLVEFLGKVAGGEDVNNQVFFEGEKSVERMVPAGIKERLKAAEMLKEWGFGLSTQSIEVEGLGEIFEAMRKKYQ